MTSNRARGRSSGHMPRTPGKVFSTEIEWGELPSLRSVKTGLHVGTDRARVIRDEFAVILREARPEAA